MDNLIKLPSGKALLELLEQCKSQLTSSDDSSNLKENIENQISRLQTEASGSSMIDKSILESLFSPNGPLQELALKNSWEKEFEELSNKWDEILDFT